MLEKVNRGGLTQVRDAPNRARADNDSVKVSAMVDHVIRLDRGDEGYGLTFYCGDLPVDDAIRAAGHEPNGYFWEGMARFVQPKLADKIEFDSEAGMFAAYGRRRHLNRLRTELEPFLSDGRLMASALDAADARGFEFDD